MVGRHDVVDPLQTEFFHQAILQGLEQSFNASLGLRTVGRDGLNIEFSHRPLELRQGLMVLSGYLLVHLVGTEFIEVNGAGLAVLEEVVTPEGEDGNHAFVSREHGFGYFSRGVVDRRQETEFTGAPAIFEPVMVRTVELFHFTKRIFAGSPLTVWAFVLSSFWCPETGRNHELTNGLIGDNTLMLFRELLGHECRTEVRVACPDQCHDFCSLDFGKTVVALPTATLMDETLFARETNAFLQTLHLTGTQGELGGRGGGGYSFFKELSDDVVTIDLPVGHRDRVMTHRAVVVKNNGFTIPEGVTFLYCPKVTLSLWCDTPSFICLVALLVP